MKNKPKKKHIHYHKDGTIWAKGFMAGAKMEGYWEWFRKPTKGKKIGTINMNNKYFVAYVKRDQGKNKSATYT